MINFLRCIDVPQHSDLCRWYWERGRIDSRRNRTCTTSPTMSFRVELWDRHAQHVRWMIAAAGTITIAQATFEAAVREWPHERFTLRQGIRLIREHPRG
jgi:hypothetical protein